MSGLLESAEVLRDVPGIAITRLTSRDVVRHELVQAIINAYEKHDAKKKSRGGHGA